MLFQIVGLFVLVVVASASPGYKPAERRRGAMEGQLIDSNLSHQKLARLSRAKKPQAQQPLDTPTWSRPVTTTKHARPVKLQPYSASTAVWQAPVLCPNGEFVRSYTLREEKGSDHFGLTQILFRCKKSNGICESGECLAKKIGMDEQGNTESASGTCPNPDITKGTGDFMTGIQVYFARNRGALLMRGICKENPGEAGGETKLGAPPSEPEFSEDTDDETPLDSLFDMSFPEVTETPTQVRNWEAGGELKCPTGSAVCGFRTKVDDEAGLIQDDTGINEIKIVCCPFP